MAGPAAPGHAGDMSHQHDEALTPPDDPIMQFGDARMAAAVAGRRRGAVPRARSRIIPRTIRGPQTPQPPSEIRGVVVGHHERGLRPAFEFR
jgi:hypothetical protein